MEAIIRVELGSSVSKMSTKEVKKRHFAYLLRRNPSLFIELANDENVQLKKFCYCSYRKQYYKTI